MVNVDNLQFLQDQLRSQNNVETLVGLPKTSTKDTLSDNFASYSSGYLSQDSFIDLTRHDLDACSYREGELSIRVPSLQQCNTMILKNKDMALNSSNDNVILDANDLDNDPEYNQEVILPDSLSNEDEPMVLITKPCLPLGKHSKNSSNSSKSTMSTSKTVTNLMSHLGLNKSDFVSGRPETCTNESAMTNGFSHLEWSASVPYNLAEEPDDCKGMKHSHSIQSMPSSASEDQAAFHCRSTDTEYGAEDGKQAKDNIIESGLLDEEHVGVTEIRKQMNEEDHNGKNIKSDSSGVFDDSQTRNKFKDTQRSALEDRVVGFSMDEETKCIDNSANFSSMKDSNDGRGEDNITPNLKRNGDGENVKSLSSCTDSNLIEERAKPQSSDYAESPEQKRLKEQKILSQKLEEFRKNSRSTKADQIRISSSRQMRAKSEDIIIKPSLLPSRRERLIASQKRHSSSLGQAPKDISDPEKCLTKQEECDSRQTEKEEANKQHPGKDSKVCSKAPEMSQPMDIPDSPKHDNSTPQKDNTRASNAATHKLSAPQLVQALSIGSSPLQSTDLSTEISAQPKKTVQNNSKRLGSLPSPPVEFKDVTETCQSDQNLAEIKGSTSNPKIISKPLARSTEKIRRNSTKSADVNVEDMLLYKSRREVTSNSSTNDVCHKKRNSIGSSNVETIPPGKKPSASKIIEGEGTKERKHNMFSNTRALQSALDCNLESMEKKNPINNMKKEPAVKDASKDNELFVIDRRGSEVVCLENTPLPSPNLSDKSKLNWSEKYSKLDAMQQPSTIQSFTQNRLGLKR